MTDKCENCEIERMLRLEAEMQYKGAMEAFYQLANSTAEEHRLAGMARMIAREYRRLTSRPFQHYMVNKELDRRAPKLATLLKQLLINNW